MDTQRQQSISEGKEDFVPGVETNAFIISQEPSETFESLALENEKEGGKKTIVFSMVYVAIYSMVVLLFWTTSGYSARLGEFFVNIIWGYSNTLVTLLNLFYIVVDFFSIVTVVLGVALIVLGMCILVKFNSKKYQIYYTVFFVIFGVTSIISLVLTYCTSNAMLQGLYLPIIKLVLLVGPVVISIILLITFCLIPKKWKFETILESKNEENEKVSSSKKRSLFYILFIIVTSIQVVNVICLLAKTPFQIFFSMNSDVIVSITCAFSIFIGLLSIIFAIPSIILGFLYGLRGIEKNQSNIKLLISSEICMFLSCLLGVFSSFLDLVKYYIVINSFKYETYYYIFIFLNSLGMIQYLLIGSYCFICIINFAFSAFGIYFSTKKEKQEQLI